MPEASIYTTLIDLCDDIAWGRPANEDTLFALTADTNINEEQQKLAEAFGLMLVKTEAREYERNQVIIELTQRNEELEEARKLLAERNIHLSHTIQDSQQRILVGQCEAMEKVRHLALSIARRPINTLVLGPTGAGKEVIAKLIHFSSPRRGGPFIAVNCTAIPESLFESEMFGIEKGVATGVNARKGLIEEAHGGTLFLDELADMSLANQSKLLRVLETRELMRVGSNKIIPVDIKIVAASNVDLMDAIAKGTFREDLYYRINVAEVRLPPLQERGEDILLLARKFLNQHCGLMGREPLGLSLQARQCLLSYAWPGNVRELNNEMERAAALTIGNMVEFHDLSPRLLAGINSHSSNTQITPVAPMAHQATMVEPMDSPSQALTPPQAKAQGKHYNLQETLVSSNTYNLQKAEQTIILHVLEQTNGNKSRAAELLGITREGLRKKLLRMDSE